ncbi:MAG: hypothetical protein HRT66_10155 [Flavobacteriaceae bacterium]|nr:hypothetical protein [Flavobacteriaceae bacterium]
MSHFLGQIGSESGSMRSLTESCNYSKGNETLEKFILKTNPSTKTVKSIIYKIMRNPDLLDSLSKVEEYYFNTNKDTIFSIPNDTIFHKYPFKSTYDGGEGVNTTYTKGNSTCGENVCCLFKYVYRFTSNSADTKDDKYKLGRGFIHLTSKSNYEYYYNLWLKADDDPNYPKSKDANKERTKANYSMDDFIELLTSDIEVAIEVSFMYWDESKKGLNNFIVKPKEGEEVDPESNEFRESVRQIGGVINAWDEDATEIKIGSFKDRLKNSKKVFNNL